MAFDVDFSREVSLMVDILPWQVHFLMFVVVDCCVGGRGKFVAGIVTCPDDGRYVQYEATQFNDGILTRRYAICMR